MRTPKGEIWFLASCVELFKDENGMSGKQAYEYLRKNGAVNFIAACWEGLHTAGPEYILDSINEYIANHTERSDLH